MSGWKNSINDLCSRISKALLELGYPAPVLDVTGEREALRMIAEALEDVKGRISPDDDLLHLKLAAEMSERAQ